MMDSLEATRYRALWRAVLEQAMQDASIKVKEIHKTKTVKNKVWNAETKKNETVEEVIEYVTHTKGPLDTSYGDIVSAQHLLLADDEWSYRDLEIICDGADIEVEQVRQLAHRWKEQGWPPYRRKDIQDENNLRN